MPSSTRSNKKTQQLLSSDPASLERSICKGIRSSLQRNTFLIDRQQHLFVARFSSATVDPDTSLVDRHSPPPSTEDTLLSSTDIFHPTSIDTSVRTSIDTQPGDMVATLILVRDERGDLQDQEGHMRNAVDDDFWQVVKQEKLQEGDFEVESSMSFGGSHWCRSMPDFEHRSTGSPEHRSTTPMESTASCITVRILTHEEFAARHPHPPIPIYVKIDRHSDSPVDRKKETYIDRQPPAPIDRRASLTDRVQMPKIDVVHLNALRQQPKPSDNPLEAIRTPSDDAADPMKINRVPMGRTPRKRKEKVAKHLKRGANEKERDSFQKRVFRIPLQKPFEESYFTHRLWMFFRETRETEEDIRRMFCEAIEKTKKRITLKKKSDPGQFAIQCGAFQVIIHFCGLFSEKLRKNCERPRVKKLQTSSRRIDDPGLIAACHCGAEYETEYSASIETHTSTSIDSAHHKSTDTPKEESVDNSPDDWENDYYNPTMAVHTRHTIHMEEYDEDYEKERPIEYKAVLDEEDRILQHSSWKRNVPSIDGTAQHQSTLILIRQTKNEHRPTFPTTRRSTLESTVYKKETTRLAVGQMITITKAMQ
ncbi:hypothetical protein F2Q69_00021806 [Brassica cretica]|uniref:Uncharacterized protein n=1 Tax=Brassica cretica TaxID=69181 RepID=A0A8S9PWK4_BRACR|nr:hypothetical protein F2Q69_00021806 [Brassica cretica]